MRPILLAFVCLYAASGLGAEAPVPAASDQTTWMSLLLDGRKIGHVEHRRREQDDRILTRERLEATLERSGASMALVSDETSIESRDGEPLGFDSHLELSGQATDMEGRIENGTLTVRTRAGGPESVRSMVWPQGALLGEGLARLERAHGLAEGTQFQTVLFDVSSLAPVTVEVRVGGRETIAVGARMEQGIRIEESLLFASSTLHTVSWVNADFDTLRGEIPLFGTSLTTVVCDEACARAPNQATDILARTMVSAPRALSSRQRHHSLIYSLSGAQIGAQLPATDEQRTLSSDSGALRLRVDAEARAGSLGPPDAHDLDATRWIESAAPRILELAQEGRGNAADDQQRMHALERFVGDYIQNKNLSVGYASALETANSRAGDCTEHALLLAALGRASGIPTRVVSGLAYAERYAGRDTVFVPHAWVLAWVDHRWQSFDAALRGFDSAHLALTVDDGDPAAFYAGLQWLGRMRIDRVDVAGRGDAQ